MDVILQRSVNAGAISDVLVNDLVADTAAVLHRQQTENVIDRQAAFMCNAPSVESLLHRLNVIEVTQPLSLKSRASDHFVTHFPPG